MQSKSQRKGWALLGATFATCATVAVSVPLMTQPVQAQDQTQTQPVKTNTTLDLDNVTVTVNGKTYQVDGRLHAVFHVHKDNAGGFHLKGHLNGQGVTITGNNTTYRGTGAANLSANVGAAKGAASEFTGVANIGLIGQGQAPNYRLHVNIHGTINANGQVTAQVANVRLAA